VVTYDETKRQANIVKHDGIDLAQCESIFDSPMLTEEDARDAYGEQRLKKPGLVHWPRGGVGVDGSCSRAAPDIVPIR